MKNLLTIILVFVLSVTFSLPISLAGTGPAPANFTPEMPAKKEVQKKKRSGKFANFIKKRVEKRIEKILKKAEKKGFGDLDRNLQLAIILGAAAFALSFLGIFIPFVGYLAGLAWLIAVVFLVLWLVENV